MHLGSIAVGLSLLCILVGCKDGKLGPSNYFSRGTNFGIRQSSFPTHQHVTEKLATEFGFKVESYEVTTADGYILNLVRIYRNSGFNATRYPVLIVHGMFTTSSAWVALGKESLALTLANDGRDVWMGNLRGTPPSQRHITYAPDSEKFWFFTPTEQGQHDIQALVEAILQLTGRRQLNFLGYSSSAQLLFIFCHFHSEDCETKIKAAVLMAPILDAVPYPKLLLGDAASVAVNPVGIVGNGGSLVAGHKKLPNGKFPPELNATKQITENLHLRYVASNFFSKPLTKTAKKILGTLTTDQATLDKISTEYPVPCSIAMVRFYRQMSTEKKGFRALDHGFEMNLWMYGSEDSPTFNLKKTNMPVFIFHGSEDQLANHEQIRKLKEVLPQVKATEEIAQCGHGDFMFSPQAVAKVHKLIQSHFKDTNEKKESGNQTFVQGRSSDLEEFDQNCYDNPTQSKDQQ